MNRILVPIDFSESAANTLKYAFAVGKNQNSSLSLIHCYPIQEYNRPYDFGELDYDDGIKAKLMKFYEFHTRNEEAENVRFIARAGAISEKVIGLSDAYKLVILSGNANKTRLDRWLGSRATIIAAKSKCPVLIVPPKATYTSWEYIWRIKRQQEDVSIAISNLTALSIAPSNVRIKTLEQEDFTSSLWQSVVDYINSEEPKLLKTIKELKKTEPINLFLLLNDHSRNNLAYYLKGDTLQIIFQFQIPVLIFQSNILL